MINIAASVDFNEKISDALQINYFGCLRMLELATQCPNLRIFTHVSTCYVNCEKFGFINEKIYDIPDDSEEIVKRICSMTPAQQEAELSRILGPWPNTYTFTKSMAERTFKKRRPANLPCVILRPSIIAAAIKEPMPGWTDTLSAAGGLSLAGGIGILNYVYGSMSNIADIVPVDYVSNSILVSTALCADKPGLTVVHASTSHQNPVRWGEFIEKGFEYIKYQPASIQVFKPDVTFIENKKLLKALFFLRS